MRTTIRLLLGVGVTLLGLGWEPSAWGQGRALQAVVARDGAGRAHVTVTNAYTAAARAFLVSCAYPAHGGEASYRIFRDGIGGPPPAVAAGGSEAVACPLNTTAASVEAVVYDDGRAEGDAAALALVGQARKLEAAEAGQALAVLSQAAASGSAPSAPELKTQLAAIAAQYAAPLQALGLGERARDYVCGPIERGLELSAAQPLATRVAGWTAMLSAFAASAAKGPQASN